MLKRIYILILSCAFFDGFCGETSVLKPPGLKSEIGYLTVEKNVTLPPVRDRIFIQPQIDLIILADNKDSYHLIYPGKNYSTACIVPKYAKYTAIMIKDNKQNTLSFRGAVEAETMPLTLVDGLELPIMKKVDDGYIAILNFPDFPLPLYVPDDLDGIRFNKESAFEIFSKTMEAKGLKYYDGSWMPADKVKKIIEKNKQMDAEKDFIWQNLKKAAAEGVVVLKNNQILYGKLKGHDNSHILFQSKGKNYWLGIDDVSHLPSSRIQMRGKLNKAEKLLKRAQQLQSNDMAVARKQLKYASQLIDDIATDFDYEKNNKNSISKQINLMMANIDESLKKQHKVIYKDTVLPEYELNYHKGKGHILLKRKYWIKPEQQCESCQGSGAINCPVCQGKGTIVKECIICAGSGKIKCSKCQGTGWKECNICGGKGFIYKKGKPQSYSFYGTTSYYPYRWRPARIITSNNSIAVIGPTPVFRPFYSGSFMSTGGGSDQAVKTVCWKCGGTGTLPCPKYRKCENCSGIGTFTEICIECKGKKNLACPKCQGKGFSGKAQQLPKTHITDKLLP